jgi:hypothetical protein
MPFVERLLEGQEVGERIDRQPISNQGSPVVPENPYSLKSLT